MPAHMRVKKREKGSRCAQGAEEDINFDSGRVDVAKRRSLTNQRDGAAAYLGEGGGGLLAAANAMEKVSELAANSGTASKR